MPSFVRSGGPGRGVLENSDVGSLWIGTNPLWSEDFSPPRGPQVNHLRPRSAWNLSDFRHEAGRVMLEMVQNELPSSVSAVIDRNFKGGSRVVDLPSRQISEQNQIGQIGPGRDIRSFGFSAETLRAAGFDV